MTEWKSTREAPIALANSSTVCRMLIAVSEPSSGTSILRTTGPGAPLSSPVFGRRKSTGRVAASSSLVAVLPKSQRARPERPCVLIAIRSADSSSAARRIASAASPRTTRERCLPANFFACSPRYATAEASSRSSTCSVSAASQTPTCCTAVTSTISAPVCLAISSTNGRIASAISEPSSGTMIFLNTRDLQCLYGCVICSITRGWRLERRKGALFAVPSPGARTKEWPGVRGRRPV